MKFMRFSMDRKKKSLSVAMQLISQSGQWMFLKLKN